LLSAASFFKSLKEELFMEEVVVTMGNVYQWELPTKKLKAEVELDELEKVIEGRTMKWKEIRELVGRQEGRRLFYFMRTC
jgi:hypothetical protein